MYMVRGEEVLKRGRREREREREEQPEKGRIKDRQGVNKGGSE